MECAYDPTLIDESSAQDGHKQIQIVGEDNPNICKDVVMETDLMKLHIENDLHEDVELQSKLQHALNVPMDEREKVEMLFQSNIKSIVACIELGKSKILKVQLLNKLNGNPSSLKF